MGKKMRIGRSLLSLLMVAVLISTNIFGMIVISADEGHSHDGIEWQAWTSTDNLPTTAGNYCLTADVTIGGAWSAPAGEINLCLNGHGIKTTSGRAIYVGGNTTLNIYDCQETEHKFTVQDPAPNGAGRAVVNDALTEGYLNFKGGYITGGNSNDGGGIAIDGVLNFYGGNIIGNNSTSGDGNGGAVKIRNTNARFNLYGGSVQYNFGRTGGAFFVEGGLLTVYGGSISHNRSAVRAGAIFDRGAVVIRGGEISENYNSYEKGAINLWGGTLEITGGVIRDNLTTAGNQAVIVTSNGFSLGGDPVIVGNTDFDNNPETEDHVGNILLEAGATIKIVGALDESVKENKIGVTLDGGRKGEFTQGWSTYMDIDADPADYFFLERGEGEILRIRGEARLVREPYVLIDFAPGEGATGKMEKDILEDGNTSYTLPTASTFTAPAGKTLVGWQLGDAIYAPGDVVTLGEDDVTFTALWTDGVRGAFLKLSLHSLANCGIIFSSIPTERPRQKMNEFEKSVLEIISQHSGIKASEIAQITGCSRQDVNSALYGVLKGHCYQDSSYRWYAKGKTKTTSDPVTSPDKRLSDICKYYLNCLNFEESNGVSAFLKSKFSLNYSELSSMTVDSADDNIARLIQKVSSEKNLVANIGYPVLIERIHSIKTNQDYFMVAPVFLFPIEISGGSVSVATIPHVNIEVIKKYSSRDINSQVYDLVNLENELGLNNPEVDIDIDEMVARLQSIRNWQWRETLNPSNITTIPPIETITEEGVYNKAIFIVTERSPYTVGLESELSKLAQLEEDSYRGTALYDWIHQSITTSDDTVSMGSPLLEVLPMNSEQEQAIRYAANNKLTIVTGPPGTGKSQVVTNLLVNEAWTGKSVLFTSKNNKAVDVVEARVNSLGRRPIMLRIGGNQYAYHLAELISDLLSYSADQNDRQEYQRYRALYQDRLSEYQQTKEKKDNIVALRNHADHMEQKFCELPDRWGKWFGEISVEEADACETVFKQYCTAYDAWNKSKNSFFGKMFWFIIGKGKTAELYETLSALNEYFKKYELTTSPQCFDLSDPKAHSKICKLGEELVYSLQTISEYRQAFDDLLDAPDFEDIDRELVKIKSELADIAEKLWKNWLITRPLQLDAEDRKKMNEYVSAMRLIGDVDLSDYPEIKKKFIELQKKMTDFLPCWAVTSLSAKGRVPFKPGIFDLIVIDEASQCDIASVLPMLYRAKRAVIIGDPKQLSHISTVSKTQDLCLLQKYNVDIRWAYSANSLYGLASGLSDPSQIIQLRDHHRSFGDIIEFSNAEFYDGKLRIATNYGRLKCPQNIEPGIRWIDVVGKTVRPSLGGAYNDAEVEAIIDEVKRLVVNNGYEGTVGVVTPFRAQAERIRQAIERNSELRNALLKNDFLVDTVHRFQGDERDLIFFSPVISNGTEQGALGFLKNTGNLFNVAITRARAVLVVVGDSGYCSKCGVSYLEHFVDHTNRTKSRQEREQIFGAQYPSDRLYPQVANPEQVSDWERLFYTALFDQGVRTIPQYPVEKYKLDFAVFEGKRLLDIEIDGEMYHKDWNGELSYRDQLRNQRLFELGWDVRRFWVYQIRDDLQGCVGEIKKWIQNAT